MFKYNLVKHQTGHLIQNHKRFLKTVPKKRMVLKPAADFAIFYLLNRQYPRNLPATFS
jgi:predicted metal-dependent peptidase